MKRPPPHHRGPAPAPLPRTHAGFMAASSALPRRARGTPGSTRRPGEDSGVAEKRCGNQDAAAEALRSMERGRATASPGELAPGAFQTGQSAPAHGEGAAPEEVTALPEVALVSWATDAAGVRGVRACAPRRWSRDFTSEINSLRFR